MKVNLVEFLFFPLKKSLKIGIDEVKEENEDKKYETRSSKKINIEQKSNDYVSSILDQDNDNVIDFFDNVDPMLAWALLKSKILPQVGTFDLLAEKAKLKHDSSDSFMVVKVFLEELEALFQDVFNMLQNCCFQSTSINDSSLALNQGLSYQFFGTNSASICVKSVQDFPLNYKEKMFKPQEMKPLQLVKAELAPEAGKKL